MVQYFFRQISFYLNVVGYKEAAGQLGIETENVLSEHSGI